MDIFLVMDQSMRKGIQIIFRMNGIRERQMDKIFAGEGIQAIIITVIPYMDSDNITTCVHKENRKKELAKR